MSESLITTLKNTVCAFLNSQGGVILIGVDNDSIVKGIRLDSDEQDQLKLFFTHRVFDQFDPPIKIELQEV
jgi:predicted HTH transcriptional regulator